MKILCHDGSYVDYNGENLYVFPIKTQQGVRYSLSTDEKELGVFKSLEHANNEKDEIALYFLEPYMIFRDEDYDILRQPLDIEEDLLYED